MWHQRDRQEQGGREVNRDDVLSGLRLQLSCNLTFPCFWFPKIILYLPPFWLQGSLVRFLLLATNVALIKMVVLKQSIRQSR